MRFSLKALLAACVYVGLVCAAFTYATLWWVEATVLLTMLAILSAAIVAVFGPRRGRAPWGGFALAGGVYFLLALAAAAGHMSPIIPVAEFVGIQIEPESVTGGANGSIPFAAPAPSSDPYAPAAPPAAFPYAYTSTNTIAYMPTYARQDSVSGRMTNRVRVGHCVFALLLGLAGAQLGAWAAQRKMREAAVGDTERDSTGSR